MENGSETDDAAKCCDHDVDESVGSGSDDAVRYCDHDEESVGSGSGSKSDDAVIQGDHDGEENVKERANGVEGVG